MKERLFFQTGGNLTENRLCRSRGGESCAYDGAMIVLQPIADTAHVVHGPIVCCGNSWQSRGTLSSKGNLYRMGFTTDMSEIDIVHGAEDKLFRAIVRTFERVNPEAIFVYSTCTSGLTGEDIDSVCRRAESHLGVRVIPVNAPGFIGPKNLGNRIAGEVLMEHVIGTAEPAYTTERDINLIGEYNIAGDLWLVEPLLKEAGFRVLSRITGNASFKEITHAHRARLNVVVCSRALINVAKKMKDRYGIPYVEVSFFGSTETTRALRQICRHLNVAKELSLRVENLIKTHQERLHRRLREFEHLKGIRAVLYTGGVKSWSFISALKDLGIETVAAGTKKSTFEDEEKIKLLLGSDALLVEDVSPANLKRIIREKGADILIAGGRNLYLAMKEGIPFVDVNQERHRAYAGYQGLINLAEDITRSIRFFKAFKNKTGKRHQRSVNRQTLSAHSKDALVVNPIKHSQTVGAVIALQAIDRTIPVIHGAQGCSFLTKVLITKHFREPVALVSTRLFTEDTVMGGGERLLTTIQELIKKHSPEMIPVLSSALTAVRGEDIDSIIKQLKNSHKDCKIIHIPTVDYEAGLEDGYARAVEQLIREICISNQDLYTKRPGQINVLVGAALTPADFTELKEIIQSFGLTPLILPDLAALDGSRKGFSSLTSSDTTIRDIQKMSASQLTIAIGHSMARAAQTLKAEHNIDYILLEGVSGLKDTDRLLEVLSLISDRKIPERYRRQRNVLIDAMADAHFYLADRKFCIATERDIAVMLSRVVTEAGGRVVQVVIPVDTPHIESICAERVTVGDLYCIRKECDVLISSSYATDRARELGALLYEMGFPVFRRIGYTNRLTIGYRGAMKIIHDIANLILQKEEHL